MTKAGLELRYFGSRTCVFLLLRTVVSHVISSSRLTLKIGNKSIIYHCFLIPWLLLAIFRRWKSQGFLTANVPLIVWREEQDAPAVVRTFCACVLANLSSPSCFCGKPEPVWGTSDLLSAAQFTVHTCFGGCQSHCRPSVPTRQLLTRPYRNLGPWLHFSGHLLLKAKQVHTPLFTDGSCTVTFIFFNPENFEVPRSQVDNMCTFLVCQALVHSLGCGPKYSWQQH